MSDAVEDYARRCVPGNVCPAYRDGKPELCPCRKRDDENERRLLRTLRWIRNVCLAVLALVLLAMIAMCVRDPVMVWL